MKNLKKLFLGLFIAVSLMTLFSTTAFAEMKGAVEMVHVNEKVIVQGFSKITKNSKGNIISVKRQKKNSNKWIITGKKAGQTSVILYDKKGKISGIMYVLVMPKNMPKFDSSTVELVKGKTLKIDAKYPKYCTLKYSSYNKKVATVSSTGKIKAVGIGRSFIRAELKYKGFSLKTFVKCIDVVKKPTKKQPVAPAEPETEPETEPVIEQISYSLLKSTFLVGEEIDPSIIKGVGHYTDGTTKELSDFEIELDTSTPGDKVLTVTHIGSGISTTFNVTVEDNSEPSLVQIYCTIEKAIFEVNEKVDSSITHMKGLYSDGKERDIPSSDCAVSVNTAREGQVTLTVTHTPSGTELYFNVLVREQGDT